MVSSITMPFLISPLVDSEYMLYYSFLFWGIGIKRIAIIGPKYKEYLIRLFVV